MCVCEINELLFFIILIRLIKLIDSAMCVLSRDFNPDDKLYLDSKLYM